MSDFRLMTLLRRVFETPVQEENCVSIFANVFGDVTCYYLHFAVLRLLSVTLLEQTCDPFLGHNPPAEKHCIRLQVINRMFNRILNCLAINLDV